MKCISLPDKANLEGEFVTLHRYVVFVESFINLTKGIE
jgi:hypothetical protein